MSGKKLFRTRLFGFKKRDVFHYLEGMTKHMQSALEQKTSENSRLIEENRDLRAEHTRLKEQVREHELNRELITQLVIDAERKANVIVQNAAAKAQEEQEIVASGLETEKLEMKRKYELEKLRVAALKAEITALRQSANNVLRQFETEIDKIMDIGS